MERLSSTEPRSIKRHPHPDRPHCLSSRRSKDPLELDYAITKSRRVGGLRNGDSRVFPMSWLQFAAGLIRDAMSSGESTETAQPSRPLPPEDVGGIVNLIDYHRAE